MKALKQSFRSGCAATVCWLLAALPASAATRYVWQDSPSPGPPFATWATAAHTIQDAVDAATAGDEIVVTNGVYLAGARVTGPTNLYTRVPCANRVVVDKTITVTSINGPGTTVIDGGGTNRCVWLGTNAVLAGFTLTNGFAFGYSGGGVWCAESGVVTNCVLTGNRAEAGCERYGESCWGGSGGGAAGGTLYNCLLTGNSAMPGIYIEEAGFGGGASGCTLNNCTLTGNLAGGEYGSGGGAHSSTLNNCTLIGNSAGSGGGTDRSTLNNCTLRGNTASSYLGGGGASGGTLNNCILTGNAASVGGGVAGNWYVGSCVLNNCILYYNTTRYGSEPNYSGSTLNYCCTTPLPTNGVGNLSLEPQLASASHLSATSPCRGSGSSAYATGTDIDGEAWGNPPSIGCDEYHAGAVTGSMSVAVAAAWTNVAVGFAVDFRALIEGRASASAWDFGDGVVVSNRPFASHAWTAPGTYPVVLRAWNESNPGGVSATVVVQVVEVPVHYVVAGSASPDWPYASWATAARTIQEAVDAATVTGALVLVSNGVYAAGGRAVDGTMTNRVAVDKPVVVRSVNGPEATIIQGYQVPGTINGAGAIRCAYLTNGAVLSGFTLTNGATRSGESWRPYYPESYGGGVWCESISAVVSNCTLNGNSAFQGGGAYGITLINCTLSGNSASDNGGGAYYSTLNNCTLTGNSAGWAGGGANQSTLNNCTLTGNSAEYGGGTHRSTLSNCKLSGNSAGLGGGRMEALSSTACWSVITF